MPKFEFSEDRRELAVDSWEIDRDTSRIEDVPLLENLDAVFAQAGDALLPIQV